MHKTLVFLAFFLCSYFAKSSHILGGYFEYKIDSVQQELELHYHLILDSTGIALVRPNTLTVNGPINFTLSNTNAPLVYYPMGDSACSVRAFYEVVFVGTLNLNQAAMRTAGRKNFTVEPECCLVRMQNVDTTNTNFLLQFSIWPSVSLQGNFYYPACNNIGRNPSMLQTAYPDVLNTLDFKLQSMPMGVDSAYHRMLDVLNEVGVPMTYNAGYSGLTPLPDKSEDSLNGNIVYNGVNRVLQAQARAGSYEEGLYLLRFRNQYFRNGNPFIVEDCAPLVYFLSRDTSRSDSLVLEVRQMGQQIAGPRQSQVLQIQAAYQDLIQLDLKAFAQVGDSVFVVEEYNSIDTAIIGLPANVAYGLPTLQSLNPNGGLMGVDTNFMQFSFRAEQANFLYGPKVFRHNLLYRTGTCNGLAGLLQIEISLKDQAFIKEKGIYGDTLLYCPGRSPALEILNPQNGNYWWPGNWLVDSTAQIANLQGAPMGWLYLRGMNGQVQDSIFLKVDNANPILGLQRGSNEDISHSGPVSTGEQVWRVSELIDVQSNQDNFLPILGSGNYSFANFYGSQCPEYSDTLDVPEDLLWASNIGPDKSHTSSVVLDTSTGDRFSCVVGMVGESRQVQTIFLYGFINPDSNTIRYVKLKVTSSGGTKDSAYYRVQDRGYVAMPFNFTVGPGNIATLEITLDSGLVYQYLTGSQISFSRNKLRFSSIRNGQLGGTLVRNNFRLPMGFRFKGEVGLDERLSQRLEVFPNPNSGRMQLHWNSKRPAALEVYNAKGSLVESFLLKEGLNIFHHNLNAGLYHLRIPAHPHVRIEPLLVR